MISVRPYSSDDYVFVLGLAPRLLIGMPPWRLEQPIRMQSAFTIIRAKGYHDEDVKSIKPLEESSDDAIPQRASAP